MTPRGRFWRVEQQESTRGIRAGFSFFVPFQLASLGVRGTFDSEQEAFLIDDIRCSYLDSYIHCYQLDKSSDVEGLVWPRHILCADNGQYQFDSSGHE